MKNLRSSEGSLRQNTLMIQIIRTIHSAFGTFFILSILHVYFTAITKTLSPWLFLTVGSLIFEGLVLALNRGQCPLTYLQHRYGDDKGFFDLFLPEWLLPYVIPSLTIITLFGFVLLYNTYQQSL